jgi:hypothetical protein
MKNELKKANIRFIGATGTSGLIKESDFNDIENKKFIEVYNNKDTKKRKKINTNAISEIILK